MKNNYVCKIATIEEMREKWDYEIRKNAHDPDWRIWKAEAIERAENGLSIAYYGLLDGRVISEATALLDQSAVQNAQGLVDDTTAYLSAFRTVEEFRGQGYFSELFGFMLADLKARGYKRVTLGVEPGEVDNMRIYFHYGFTEFIKLGVEHFPSGGQIDVLYYGMRMG